METKIINSFYHTVYPYDFERAKFYSCLQFFREFHKLGNVLRERGLFCCKGWGGRIMQGKIRNKLKWCFFFFFFSICKMSKLDYFWLFFKLFRKWNVMYLTQDGGKIRGSMICEIWLFRRNMRFIVYGCLL